MAEGKKSFVLYSDQRGIFEKLPNEEAGKLIKHIYSYVNDENPEADFIIEIAFESIKNQLKRDLEKWDKSKIKRAEAGRKGGKATQSKLKQNKAMLEQNKAMLKQGKANQAVNDNVNVNVNVNDNVNDNSLKKNQKKEIEKRFLDWFNSTKEKITGTKGKFKTLTPTDKNNLEKLYKSYSQDDFTHAVKSMFQNKWAIDTNNTTPAHFLRMDNFNKYLNSEVQNLEEIERQKKVKNALGWG